MFTGIIRDLGVVSDLTRAGESVELSLERPATFVNMRVGDSVAVNGACLTVLMIDSDQWQVRLMHETLAKTSLGQLTVGSTVNLELPLVVGARLDGHFVHGHIDGVAEIVDIAAVGDDRVLRFQPPSDLMTYFMAKGSVALDGVSLTIVDTFDDSFTVSLMPYTLEHTTFGTARVGQHVNVEADMLGKYVARLINH